jgi:serine/threonine protein kinase/tetratricopeptide (TPR) repeat protein
VTPKSIGHYEITGTLGEGGMGIVYAARDRRLNRPVALKMIRQSGAAPDAAERLRREAQAAASVNHPNVCQLYDIGEEDGEIFIAMEQLEGEPLASRLARGPIELHDAIEIELAVLAALEALHTRGMMHRDLKPSNIFLTPHGVKLLDFGLALAIGGRELETRLTMPGMIVGTPQYLPPEQTAGQPGDARGDLFAAGTVLYEMLTGRSPFSGRTLAEILHAIAYEHPPALGGSPAVAAVDRVIHKAIAKRPRDRYQSAAAMADELRAAKRVVDSGTVSVPIRAMSRLIVLPFRLLRPDPDIDFLAFGLSDALTTSLSGLGSLVVRSSLTASRFAGEAADLEAIAEKADVDVVLTGTLLRAEDRLRVTAQLAEVPAGTVLWSQTTQVTVGDVFQLQDTLTARIVEALSVPLSARDERVLKRDVPATAKAYEFYLRANQLAYEAKNASVARDLYRQCLEEDPDYAPAWARLARVYRLVAMYTDEGAEDNFALSEAAFRRALELNPELSLAHNLYTAYEVETGGARQAMRRLLQRAQGQTADPELFAGLVQACRFAGLERPAIAAHEHAQRLEPRMRTAVAHAYFAAGQFARAIDTDVESPALLTSIALDLLGRRGEAIDHLRQLQQGSMPGFHRLFLDETLALLEGRKAAALELADALIRAWTVRDPCAGYYLARTLVAMGHPRGLERLRMSIEGGFHAHALLVRDPWLDPLRDDQAFRAILATAEEGARTAAEAYLAAGGERILGPAV